jgi:hypothetical protein
MRVPGCDGLKVLRAMMGSLLLGLMSRLMGWGVCDNAV